MEYLRGVRSLLFVALSVLCLLTPGLSISIPARSVVWFSDHKTLKAIDTEVNSVANVLHFGSSPVGLAFDPDAGALWVLRGRDVVKLAPSGEELLDIDVGRLRPDIDHPEHLVIDPYDGSLWIAGGKEVAKLSASGQHVAYWRAPESIEGLALDVDQSLWLLTHRKLHHLARDGVVLDSVDLETFGTGTQHLAIDGLGSILWIGDQRRLLRLDLNQVARPPIEFAVPEVDDDGEPSEVQGVRHIQALAVHPLLGTLWVVTYRHLLVFDRNGNRLRSVELPGAIGFAKTMAFDSASSSLWIGGTRGIGRFEAGGELSALVPVDKEADNISVAGFTLRPQVSIREPAGGGVTNNARPPIRLLLGATCNGAPCLLPDVYMQSLHLEVALDGVHIGPEFEINGAEATYAPPYRLPEGANILVAGGTDLFGHRSDDAETQFVIDTTPPRFMSLAPADGSIASNAATVISGSVDDPTANVVLADVSGNGISIGDASFNFAVLLKPGLNAFVLTARDAAGNETIVPLHISLNAIAVKIVRPATGTALTTRGTIVSGDFAGPANTGITVNGVVAQVLGSHFYANLVLSTGPNSVSAIATTPEGATVTDSVAVTVDASAAKPVEVAVEPTSGAAPLKVRITAITNSTYAVKHLSFDANGDGTLDIAVDNPADPIEYVYATPGVYQTTITAIDGAGAVTEQAVAIVVNDPQQMDQLFASIWNGMNDALVRGDIATAVSFLNDSAKLKYQPVFEALKQHFPEIIASYSPLSRVSISQNIGEYGIVRPSNGQNQLYLIYFLRDVDGVWRVDAM
jgi:PKD repeat protein